MAEELTAFDRRVMAQLAEFYQDEKDQVAPKAEIKIGPFTAYVAISALQLAWRHPSLSDIQKTVIEDLARQLEVLFTGDLAEALKRGWDLSADVERPA